MKSENLKLLVVNNVVVHVIIAPFRFTSQGGSGYFSFVGRLLSSFRTSILGFDYKLRPIDGVLLGIQFTWLPVCQAVNPTQPKPGQSAHWRIGAKLRLIIQ